jgi:hypothetical protein
MCSLVLSVFLPQFNLGENLKRKSKVYLHFQRLDCVAFCLGSSFRISSQVSQVLTMRALLILRHFRVDATHVYSILHLRFVHRTAGNDKCNAKTPSHDCFVQTSRTNVTGNRICVCQYRMLYMTFNCC